MIVTVDTTSGVPPYEQVRTQVARMIGAGVLAPASRLPTSRRREGTTVAERPPRVATREIRAELDAAVEQFVLQVRQLGADPDAALARARTLLDA